MADVNGNDLTQRLIDTGARMLAELGPTGLSLRKLAAAAGTSTMAVYTRFGDKQALLAAMRREGFRRFGAQLATSTVDPIPRLVDVGRGYRRAALASPPLYALMFGPLPAGLSIDPVDQTAADATYLPLLDGVRAAVDAGAMSGEPDRIAMHLWAVVHGAVTLELSGYAPPPGVDAEQHFDEALAFAAVPFLERPPTES